MQMDGLEWIFPLNCLAENIIGIFSELACVIADTVSVCGQLLCDY